MITFNPYVDLLEKNCVITKYFPVDLKKPFEIWSKDRIKEYQLESLKEIVRHVYQKNPFYRAKLDKADVSPDTLNSLEDFRRIPFLSKDEIRRKPQRTLCQSWEEIAQVHISTGTTSQSIGDHLYSLLSWDDIFLNEVAARFGLLMPHCPGDVVVVALPFEMSSAGFSMHRAYQNTLNAMVVNAGKGGFYSDPEKIVMVMRDLHAQILCTTAPFALWLSEIAEALEIDVQRDIGLKFMWLCGEGFSWPLRKRLEEIWGCVCLTYYSSLECGPMGIECIMQNGLHISENYNFVEIIDPQTDELVPDGTIGEICVTNLYRFGAPFIRYRTQDIGWIDRTACSCCLELPRLFLKGRAGDQIVLEDCVLSPFEIECALYKCKGMGNNYYIVNKKGCYDVHVEMKRGHSAEKLKQQIEAFLKERGLDHVIIHDAIPRSYGKSVRVRKENNDGD